MTRRPVDIDCTCTTMHHEPTTPMSTTTVPSLADSNKYALRHQVFVVTSYCVSKTYGVSVATSRFNWPEVVKSHADWFIDSETGKSLGEKRHCTVLRISVYSHVEFPDITQTEEHWVEPFEPTKVIRDHTSFTFQPCVEISPSGILTDNIK